jgi:WD40-like Beta Propeller Repeat
MFSRHLKILSSWLFIALVAACGGGGGGGGGSSPPPQGGPAPSGGGATRSSLPAGARQGTLLFDDGVSSAIKRIDMTTGTATIFSTLKWFRPYIGPNGEVSVDERPDVLHQGFQTRITLAQLASGVVNSMIDFIGPVLFFHSQIVISPDGQLLAFELHTGPTIPQVPLTRIVQRDGKVLGEYQGLGQPSWTSDQRLVMCEGNKIRRTGVESTTTLTNAQVLAVLPTAPFLCKLNAQGDKLAMLMSDRPNAPAHLWVANIDGTELHQVTTSIKGPDAPFAWSPDGKFLAVVLTSCGDVIPIPEPVCAFGLHVVPWDADKIDLSRDTGKVIDSLTGSVAQVNTTGDLSWR